MTRYNKPVAVIISYDEYENSQKKNEDDDFWLDKWRKSREEYADVLDNEGIPLPPKVYPDPNRKIFED